MEKTITVPTGYVRYLLSQVEKQGYNLDELLAVVGIEPTEIEQRTEFSAIKFGQLYQRIMWTAQDESFGMVSGGRVPNGTFRMMCHAIIHCPTLERAIYRCSAFYEICRGTKVKPRLVRKGRYAKLSFAPVSSVPGKEVREMLQNEAPAVVRTGLSMWHHFISWLIGSRLDLKAAYFTFPRQEDSYHYETLFQSELIAEHLEETGSSHAENILANFDEWIPKFYLVKPQAADLRTLLGHQSRSAAELRVQAQ